MKANRLIILLENSITLSRYSFGFSALDQCTEIILLYPEQDQEAVRPYLNHFSKTHPIEHACDVIGIDEISTLDFSYVSLIKYVKAILRNYEKKNVVLLSSFEFYLLALAKLRHALSIPGIREKDLIAYRDKFMMHQQLLKKVRMPKTLILDLTKHRSKPEVSFKHLLQKLGKSFVIKPTKGSSSVGVYQIKSYRQYLRILAKLDNDTTYIIQEFITGRLYHVDIGMKNASIFFSAACRYTNGLLLSNKPSIIGSIPVMDSKICALFIKESRLIIQALGTHDGFFHLEFFYNGSGRPIFLECGYRPGGGYLSHQYEKMYGFNMYDVNLMLAANPKTKQQQVFDTIYQLGFGAYLFPNKELNINFFETNSYFSIKKHKDFYECLLWNENKKALLKDIKFLFLRNSS